MISALALVAAGLAGVSAQTFQRLGTCPTLGCVFPPDQAEFLPGALFDIRLEVHAPVNGSEAFNGGNPDTNFELYISKEGQQGKTAAEYFSVDQPEVERWNFTYFEDLFAQDADTPTVVNVAAKAYRKLALYEPGNYTATMTYYNGSTTDAHWTVVAPVQPQKKAKNVILFIGDGMTQSMITAARLIAHKSINGKYQTRMALDQMEAYGMHMAHSIDTYITDSANSATALYTGKKSTVNALNVYVDSSRSPWDDPKIEAVGEIWRRQRKGGVGIVSTAYIADATPAAVCTHTRLRSQYAGIVYEYLNGPLNETVFPWGPGCEMPDVIFGGGAEQFIPGRGSWNRSDFYEAFRSEGYNVVYNNSQLQAAGDSEKTLGIFSISNMAKWVDRNVFPQNLEGLKNGPTGDNSSATDQPGLAQMTLKAIDILKARSNDQGFFLMSEAASIDKMMHVLDYDRALGELLELDDTVRQTMKYLQQIGELDDTLILVTADHGHGFDIVSSVDTTYLAAQEGQAKRNAIGIYEQSGLSAYTVENGTSPTNHSIVVGPQGENFPVNWQPRYTLGAGVVAFPDHNEAFRINTTGPRIPAIEGEDGTVMANPFDQANGFAVSGNLPLSADQGVHSLTDVPVFATGPGSELFRGVYDNTDFFYKLAHAADLSQTQKPS